MLARCGPDLHRLLCGLMLQAGTVTVCDTTVDEVDGYV